MEQGKTRIYPESWEETYFHWMRNIRDWCVSRQLWWGHRIPAWYCEGCSPGRPRGDRFAGGHAASSPGAVRRLRACRGSQLVQDPDVLDTWFSSALWPFTHPGLAREDRRS